jgi:SOS response regulatory protein OraA/RecX
MLTKIKTWFLRLKTWQKVVVGFVAFSFLVAPFSGGAETSAPAGDSGTAPQVTEMPEPMVTEMPTDNPAPASNLTVAQLNAVEKALSYLEYSAFSKKGLVKQLKYEDFSSEDSEFAVDYIEADWFEQAAKEAEGYLDYSSFSRKGLIKQLIYEGYTEEQAVYGVDYIEADWFEQAAKEAEGYLDYSSFSRKGLIKQLIYEGYTEEQAIYGVEQAGL